MAMDLRVGYTQVKNREDVNWKKEKGAEIGNRWFS